MNKKILYSIASMTLIVVLAVIASTVKPSFSDAQTTSSGLSGYAWSDGIGWINFNSAGVTGARVMVDSNTGALSGSAWSDGAGWLSFDRSVTGNPPFDDPGTLTNGVWSGPVAKKSSNNIIGWARFVSACYNNPNIIGYTLNWNGSKCNYVGPGTSNGVSTGTTGEYWDGWVSFNRKNSGETVGTSYSVTVDSTNGALKGYAWGGGNVGWILFNNTAGNIITDNPVIFTSGGSSLAVSCTPSVTAAELPPSGGYNVIWSSAVSGGTAPYTYAWSGTNFSGTQSTANSWVANYTSAGTKSASISVTDSSLPTHITVTGQQCGATVSISNPPPPPPPQLNGCTAPPNSTLCGNVSDAALKTYTGYNFGDSCPASAGIQCNFQCIDNTYIVRGNSCIKKSVEVEQ